MFTLFSYMPRPPIRCAVNFLFIFSFSLISAPRTILWSTSHSETHSLIRKEQPLKEESTYRHELKFPIGFGEYLALRQRLRPVMKPDPHAGADGRYLIRSIYFDNFNDKALREKIDGVQKREKFRIRWYNGDLSHIRLEKKMKHNNLSLKLSARLSEAESRALCQGDMDGMTEHPSELVRELCCKMTLQQLRPKTAVSYWREPYIYAPGNVRLTFDSHIRTGLFHRDFFSEDLKDIPATDAPGDMILEVKYDEFLPEIIAHLLQTEGLRQEAFSKYGACRRFG